METYLCPSAREPIEAVVGVPGSKSITNRALICAALADGHSLLTGALFAEDTELMIGALTAMGIACTVDPASTAVEISGCRGQLPASSADVFCGNSGTTLRFCTALAATGHGEYHFDGILRMRERPIAPLIAGLRQLGIRIRFEREEGFPPHTVLAERLSGGEVAMNGSISSQFISALLMAAPMACDDVYLTLNPPLASRSYIHMTQAVIEAFGASVVGEFGGDGGRIVIPAPQRYEGRHYAIEPDASSASYFFAAAAATGGRVTVKGLGANSIQGDVALLDCLERMGCRTERDAGSMTVIGPADGALWPIQADLNDMPDMAQTLAVLALFARGESRLTGLSTLVHKETDRLAALDRELTQIGAGVERKADALSIRPPKAPRPAQIATYGDHRMAMSFAVAGLRIPGLAIEDPACVAKTFPDFFQRWEWLASGSKRKAN